MMTRGSGERQEEKYSYRTAHPLLGRELGSWTPASVVWFSPAWLCVSSSGPWLCAQGALRSLCKQTTHRDKREEKTGAQIKTYFSVIHQ